MAHFRKKPVVIEAVHIPDEATARRTPGLCTGGMGCHGDAFEDAWPHVHTLEGDHTWTPGDWLITGVKGERYFCKPDIFAATYEPDASPRYPSTPQNDTVREALAGLMESVDMILARFGADTVTGVVIRGFLLTEPQRARAALSAPSPAANETTARREPIRWDPCATGFWDVEELNRRYGAGRFVAVGGPDTLYDTGPDRKGKTRVPTGWWICDVNGVPAFAAERPPPSPSRPEESATRDQGALALLRRVRGTFWDEWGHIPGCEEGDIIRAVDAYLRPSPSPSTPNPDAKERA